MEAQETPQIEQETRVPKKRELALVSRSTYLKEKALQWINRGAQPSDTARRLLEKCGVLNKDKAAE